MPTQSLDPSFQQMLGGRHIATLGSENPDGTIHLIAVWYLFEGGEFYVGTSSKSRKARNLTARPQASLMVDVRTPAAARGATAIGTVKVIFGDESRALNERIHRRYMSSEAMSDPAIGPVFAAFDDVTLRLTPASWISWDMAALDAQAMGGRLGGTPGYLLPLD